MTLWGIRYRITTNLWTLFPCSSLWVKSSTWLDQCRHKGEKQLPSSNSIGSRCLECFQVADHWAPVSNLYKRILILPYSKIARWQATPHIARYDFTLHLSSFFVEGRNSVPDRLEYCCSCAESAQCKSARSICTSFQAPCCQSRRPARCFTVHLLLFTWLRYLTHLLLFTWLRYLCVLSSDVHCASSLCNCQQNSSF